MKKIIALALTAVLALAMFACGDKEETTAGTTAAETTVAATTVAATTAAAE